VRPLLEAEKKVTNKQEHLTSNWPKYSNPYSICDRKKPKEGESLQGTSLSHSGK
jgi:hypothetical protein